MKAVVLVCLSVLLLLTCVDSIHPIGGGGLFASAAKAAKAPRTKLDKKSAGKLLNLNGGSIEETIEGAASVAAAAVSGSAGATGSEGIPLFAVKILLQLVLTGINAFSWSFPLRNKNFRQNTDILGLANAFAGGIFLMLSFGHMLPEAVEILDSIGADRNLAFNFVLVGYMLVFFVEKIAFDAHSIMHQAMDNDAPVVDLSHGHNHGHFYAHHDLAASLHAISHTHEHTHGGHSITTSPAAAVGAAAALAGVGADAGGAAVCNIDHSHSHHEHNSHGHTTVADVNTDTTHEHGHAHTTAATTTTSVAPPSLRTSSNKKESDSEKSALSPKSAIVLLLAMSLHSLFETMALGLANDKTSAILMAASIGLHQPAESIALLVAFLKTNMPVNQVVRWLAMFSAIGPLGVTAGVLISKIASPLVDALIMAVTAGTFLYVGATEVISEEFEDVSGPEKWKRFAALLGGMGMIAGVTRLTGGWEGGGEHAATAATAVGAALGGAVGEL